MLKNFFKVAIRNLWRNKGFSAVNIIGLAIGMASALLIGAWVQNEMSVDRFHKNAGRIYLLYSGESNNGSPDVWPRVSSLMATELKKDYAEVADAVRFRTVYFLMTKEDKHINAEGAFADSGFLKTFSFPLLKGDANTALNTGEGIVLTEKLARSLFGDEDPLGNTVRIDSNSFFKVTGILKDLPGNTQFTFQYLLPWSYVARLGWENGTWQNTTAPTYVLLKPGASREAFDTKIKYITRQHVTEGYGSARETITQPLTRAYLYAKAENGHLTGGRIAAVRLFMVIAGFIVLIACINFMNLSTARSEKRAREVGIRKVVGALKSSLVAQFIGESIFLSVISFIMALALVQLSLTSFNHIIGVSLAIDFANPYFWLFAMAFVLFTGFIAGSYPAFFLSSYQPVKVLKGTFKAVNALVTPRKVLVVLQFTFAIMLITCTIIVQRQLRYARERDTGYNREQLVYTFSQGDIIKHYDLIKQDLLTSGAAVSVTKTYSPMTRAWGTISGFSWPGSSDADKKFNFMEFEADADFVRTTGTRLLQGRDLDLKAFPTDSAAILLNESAVKMMHLKDPVGTSIKNEQGANLHIIGVVKDFIIGSPYDKIEPMIIQGLSTSYPVVHFRLNPANTLADNLAKAGKVFKQYNPQQPFEYYFVDESYNQKFKSEQREGALGILFAGLTILISCLGLFGLTTYMAENRTKEIGIRKVLGASVAAIAALIARDFIKLVLIAVVIASPIAWFAMHKWLQSFDYRVNISSWVFLASGLLAVLIALATISYQAIKASLANPVKSLRTQ